MWINLNWLTITITTKIIIIIIIIIIVTLSSCFFRLVYVSITSISKVFANKQPFYTEMDSDICDNLGIPNYSWTFSLLFFRLVKDKQLLIPLHLCHNLNKNGHHTYLEYCYISVPGPYEKQFEVAEYPTMTKPSTKFYKSETTAKCNTLTIINVIREATWIINTSTTSTTKMDTNWENLKSAGRWHYVTEWLVSHILKKCTMKKALWSFSVSELLAQ
jgi:hypothetical protein